MISLAKHKFWQKPIFLQSANFGQMPTLSKRQFWQNPNFCQTQILAKYQFRNFAKTEMYLKVMCQQNWKVTNFSLSFYLGFSYFFVSSRLFLFFPHFYLGFSWFIAWDGWIGRESWLPWSTKIIKTQQDQPRSNQGKLNKTRV